MDDEALRAAANDLADAEDAVQTCPACFPDAWCLPHAEQWGEAMHRLRSALGRTDVAPQTDRT
jgi:hypothetical protein